MAAAGGRNAVQLLGGVLPVVGPDVGLPLPFAIRRPGLAGDPADRPVESLVERVPEASVFGVNADLGPNP